MIERGVSYLKLRPDRVAMQDATAQVSVNVQVIYYLKSRKLLEMMSCHVVGVSSCPVGVSSCAVGVSSCPVGVSV